MASLICKQGVRFEAFPPELLRILTTVATCAAACTAVASIVITSANDGQHLVDSKHYSNQAIDLRTRDFADDLAVLRFAAALRTALGDQFTVLYESPGKPNQHLHVQLRRGQTFKPFAQAGRGAGPGD